MLKTKATVREEEATGGSLVGLVGLDGLDEGFERRDEGGVEGGVEGEVLIELGLTPWEIRYSERARRREALRREQKGMSALRL